MAIISVEEITGRSLRLDGQSKTISRVWRVICDAVHAQVDIVNAVGLPLLYQAHPNYPGAEASGLRVEQSTNEDEPFVWEVSVEFATGRGIRGGGGGGLSGTGGGQVPEGQRAENPLQRSPKVRFRWEYIEYHPYVSLPNPPMYPDGRPYWNSRTDPFEPAPPRQETIFIISITKNVASVDYRELAYFNDSVNEDDFLDFEPGEVLLTFEDSELQRENGVEFWPLTGVFKCRRFLPITVKRNPTTPIQQLVLGGWDDQLLECGFYHDVGTPRVKTPFAPFGATDVKPQPLDDKGRMLGANAPLVFATFPKKKRRPFAELGFF